MVGWLDFVHVNYHLRSLRNVKHTEENEPWSRICIMKSLFGNLPKSMARYTSKSSNIKHPSENHCVQWILFVWNEPRRIDRSLFLQLSMSNSWGGVAEVALCFRLLLHGFHRTHASLKIKGNFFPRNSLGMELLPQAALAIPPQLPSLCMSKASTRIFILTPQRNMLFFSQGHETNDCH